MKCPQCQNERSNYSFYSFRGNQHVAKSQFFTRPIEDINGACFDCAGPYRCLTCGEVKDASEFRLQGRICHSCKSAIPTSEGRVNFNETDEKGAEYVEPLENAEMWGLP